MKIIKYKKLSNHKYDIYLDDGNKITLYEDVILKENLLVKKEIDDIDKITELNNKYESYEMALRYLNKHVVSIKEMHDYLNRKGINESLIDMIIDKLIKNGYLNDSFYAKCYINDKINLTNYGPLKIKKHLMNNNIDSNIYEELLEEHENIWEDRIKRYIDKQLKINKKSNYYFKNKMLINLINLGYDKDMINILLNKISIDNQDELMKKEREKIINKLKNKYSGNELERKVKEKLYQKGFFE